MTSFLRSLRMVAWSFLGIRKSSESQEETASLNPLHIVGAGLVGVAVFVMGLVLLVNWVLGT
ncbi:MAG: DUF2970 domain-containing protein [Comamonadaceae bacterium]|jgi:amino acid transporter